MCSMWLWHHLGRGSWASTAAEKRAPSAATLLLCNHWSSPSMLRLRGAVLACMPALEALTTAQTHGAGALQVRAYLPPPP